MNLTGVICEYNPFHTGHEYQLSAARSASGEDCALVCVMGGNFLQRGEPAIVNKHARARMAALCGADLVLELPLPWAIASAERFAAGGVALLAAIGAQNIAFGAECPDAGRLDALAEALLSREGRELISRRLLTGQSYAAAREAAMAELLGNDAALLRSPNNILAVEYLKAIRLRGLDIAPIAVPRFGPDHDGGAPQNGLAPAMTIRKLMLEGGDPSPFIPEPALRVLSEEISAGRAPVSPGALEQATLYRLRTMTDAELSSLPDCTEGLERRFRRAVMTQPSLADLLAAVKTRRYAHSRLRRMATAALLGVKAADQLASPPYLRVLALGRRGREALRQIKADTTLPIITKPAAARLLPPDAARIFELEARAGDIYALAFPDPAARAPGLDWTTSPALELQAPRA